VFGGLKEGGKYQEAGSGWWEKKGEVGRKKKRSEDSKVGRKAEAVKVSTAPITGARSQSNISTNDSLGRNQKSEVRSMKENRRKNRVLAKKKGKREYSARGKKWTHRLSHLSNREKN